ncbi:unnamed protein product [Arabis nemorensis]|uniref:FLZ-type domain-containing protein n=1 Tax=Arabis nemorensis TaxID=586526 RepID=A0A565BZE5_9BRAS|nr:unnamed protein product [Arabis nemorensis]
MLRNKPRAGAVTTKQATLMANQLQSSKPNNNTSSLFTSPKFRFFTSKITPFDSDNLSLISPTSILDINPSIFSKNPKPTSYFEPTIPDPQRFHSPDAIGLADLVKNRDSTNREDRKSKLHVNKMVLFGSKLRVRIPSGDFGTKTMRYHGQVSPCLQAKVLTVSEIDQTEDYTRVISHGPNPTITHIFDNSVFVETTPCSVSLQPPVAMETKKMESNFLSYCYTCKKNLDKKQDIFIYRCVHIYIYFHTFSLVVSDDDDRVP